MVKTSIAGAALTRELITPGAYVLVGPQKFTGSGGLCNNLWRVLAVNDQCVVIRTVDVTGGDPPPVTVMPWFHYYDFYDGETIAKQLVIDHPIHPSLAQLNAERKNPAPNFPKILEDAVRKFFAQQ